MVEMKMMVGRNSNHISPLFPQRIKFPYLLSLYWFWFGWGI